MKLFFLNYLSKMLINSQKSIKNFLLLKKGGLRLFNTYKRNTKLNSKSRIKKIAKSVCNPSKGRPIIDIDVEEIKKDNKKNEIINSFSNKSINMFNLKKYMPKISEYKKRLYIKNILSTEKEYLLQDYMKHKEIDLIKNNNNKTVYEARKTFFSDNQINDNRTSYFYKEKLFDEKKKFPLMIKDIQSNFILLKNKRYKQFKNYSLFLEKKEDEKNNFKDFNEKLGVKYVYIKNDKLIKNNKTFMNNKFKLFTCENHLKSFGSSQKRFSQKRKKIIIK